MKRFSLLATVVVASLLAALAIAATSASAAVLCKKESTICQSADTYPLGTQFHANLKAGKLFSIESQGFGLLNWCTSASIDATTKEVASTETLRGRWNEFKLGGCQSNINVTYIGNQEYQQAAYWNWTSGKPGRFNARPLVEFTTPKSYGIQIPCKYVLEGYGNITEGNKLVFNQAYVTWGGYSGENDWLCPTPTDVSFSGTFDITTPTPVYVAP